VPGYLRHPTILGWAPDGQILARTSHGQPFGHHTWAYAIPVEDGQGRFSRLQGHRPGRGQALQAVQLPP